MRERYNEGRRTPKDYREEDVINRWWYRDYIHSRKSYGSENLEGVANSTEFCYTRNTKSG